MYKTLFKFAAVLAIFAQGRSNSISRSKFHNYLQSSDSSSSSDSNSWSKDNYYSNCHHRQTIPNPNNAINIPCPARRQNIDVKIRPGKVKTPQIYVDSGYSIESHSVEINCPHIGPQKIYLRPGFIKKPKISYKSSASSCSSSASSSESSSGNRSRDSSSGSDSSSSSSSSSRN